LARGLIFFAENSWQIKSCLSISAALYMTCTCSSLRALLRLLPLLLQSEQQQQQRRAAAARRSVVDDVFYASCLPSS